MEESEQLGQVLMARQPIFDRDQNVVAYELLYRTEQQVNHADIPFCGSTATSQVILNVYSSIFDSAESRRVPAFINLTEELLLSGNFPDLPRKRVVLEILEDVKVTDELIEAVRKLRDDGYRIALDDYLHDDSYAPLLELAHIVKVDVLDMSLEQIQHQVDQLKPYQVTLLAEKIETHEMMEACKQMGFRFFQGYFLSKPKLIKGRKLEGNQMALMQLLQEIQSPQTTPEKLEELIMMDPVLTYRLLRIVNSADFNLVRNVQSISEAIVMMGLEEVRKWATLIAMTASEDKPEELSRQLLMRGRMCEQIARQQSPDQCGAAFMAGMLSGLDALLDVDRETLMQQVPLDDCIKTAITSGEGAVGTVLQNVMMYERADWDALGDETDFALYESAYRDSLKWASESIEAMAEEQ